MTELQFSDLQLSEHMLAALDEMGYERPTPVQQSSIPLVFTGRDLMVQSHTGSGKTAAFGIPTIERLASRPGQGVRVLVLAPTRELAKQVADEMARLGRFHRIATAAVYGGASMDKQVAEMKFAAVVAGTPGRVLDHLRRGSLRLDRLEMLILDEADEMLSMGFAKELDDIMQFVPEPRQTLLFSATIPEDIRRYARRFMKEPEFLSLIEDTAAPDDIEHHYYMVSGVGRSRDLVQVIEFEEPDSAIVFCNTRADSEIVATFLKRQGYDAEYLNGDLPQSERERIMARTKDKSLRFLVATDIAARGIDISGLSHVINFQLPESPEVYIHRTGRTGRAGREGTAISLIGPREIGVYYYLKRIYKLALQERSVPTQAEIELRREERRTQSLVSEILEAVGGEAPSDPALRAQTVRLLERDDAVEVVGALLAVFRQRREVGAAEPAKRAGGVLESVPKPAAVAPGGRPTTLEGVAQRVAIVQGEFRGLPGGRKSNRERARISEEERQAIEQRQRGEPVPVPSQDASAEQPPRDEAPVDRMRAEREPRRPEPQERRPEVDDRAEERAGLPSRREPQRDARGPERRADCRPSEPSGPVIAERAPAGRGDGDDGLLKLYVSIGERDNVDADALRDTLADLAGLEPEDLVEIDMHGRHSYVSVHADFAEDLIAAVNGETFGNRKIRVELARDEA